MSTELSAYTPIVVLFLLAGGIGLVILVLSHILGPTGKTKFKHEPFECGSDPIGDARMRFPVKFYLVVIVFIVFDIEGIFVVPWAVLYNDLGVAGFIEMFVFLVVLAVGLLYVWRKGGLEWE